MFQRNIPDFWTIFKFKRDNMERGEERDREKWIKLIRFIIYIFLTKLKVEHGILKHWNKYKILLM